jgi:hypothetical protein
MGKTPDMKTKTIPKPKLTDAERHKRFVEEARAAEADETEEGAERAFRSVVKPPQRPSKSRA